MAMAVAEQERHAWTGGMMSERVAGMHHGEKLHTTSASWKLSQSSELTFLTRSLDAPTANDATTTESAVLYRP